MAAPPTSKPSETRQLFDDGICAVTCEVEFWRTDAIGTRTSIDEIVEELSSLVRPHWGERDPATLLPYLKSAVPLKQFVALMRELAANGHPAAVLHTDLDDFKAVNSDHGETVGDAVLREFTDRLRSAFADLGTPVRTGGEEFSAILYGSSIAEIVRATDAFRRLMQDEPLAAIHRTNTCSIGLCLYPSTDHFLDVTNQDQILQDARNAERRAKKEGKNRIALMGPLPPARQPCTGSPDHLALAALASRRILTPEKPDNEDEFAEFIVERIAGGLDDVSGIAAAIQKVKDELGLLIGNYDAPQGRPAFVTGIVDSMTWATWVLRAVLLAAYRKILPLEPQDTVVLRADAAGALSLEIGDAVVPLNAQALLGGPCKATGGRPFYPAGEELDGGIGRKIKRATTATAMDPMSPVLLLPIGDEARTLAGNLRHLVGAVVEIDDRPARGGGLPDFWQSNVSRVIRACLNNSNITTVIAIGDKDCAQHTLDWLGATRDDSRSSDLQSRLSLTSEKVEALRTRQLEVREVGADLARVISEISAIVDELAPLEFSTRPEFDSASEQSKRRLPIAPPDAGHRLALTDGLQTRTLADAYPEAVQLIRGAEEKFDFLESSRGKFREFTGFKVVLTDPLSDMVPDYWRSDQNSLDAYYERSFKDSDLLFGKRLKNPLKDEGPTVLDFAIEQTADALQATLPTRRINLPISPDDLHQPLGLSTIQILPRHRGEEQRLDVIFVWRTVDALVGFPFSAYGSICWAREFVQKVNDRLMERSADFHVSLGTLTYVALSFHMYLHNGDLEIARTIVQDASL